VAPIGPNLGANAEAAEQRECAPRGARVDEVEMHGDRSLTEVPGAGGMEQRRQLGQAATLTSRGDRRQLVSEVVRE